MFFKVAKQGENKWWKYIISLFIIVLVWQVLGGAGLLAGIAVVLPEGVSMDDAVQVMDTDMNFEKLGIESNYGLVLLILTFACGLLGLWISMKLVHKRPFKTLITPFESINYKKIFTAAFLWFALMGVFELFSYFLDPGNYTFHFDGSRFFILVLISILLLPIQTSFEELLMRGYLMQGIGIKAWQFFVFLFKISFFIGGIYFLFFVFENLSKDFVSSSFLDRKMKLLLFSLPMGVIYVLADKCYRKIDSEKNIRKTIKFWIERPIFPLIVTSLIFGSLHMFNPEVKEYGLGIMMVNYIQIGLMLGIITLMDDSLELALGVHAANNIYGATMVTFGASALKTPALFTMQELDIYAMTIAGLFGSLIFILLLSKIYGWSDWSKLWGKIDISFPNKNIDDSSIIDENLFADNN